MPAVKSVGLPLIDATGKQRGTINLGLLPNGPISTIPPLLDLREEDDRDTSLEPVQLLEAWQYRYNIALNERGDLDFNRPEIFEPDDASGLTGRLRTKLTTGVLPVVFTLDKEVIGELKLEIRSRKIDYVTQYRYMLRDLAEIMSEVVMERFAASEQKFTPDESTDARMLYQRFAFLSNLLKDEFFDSALRRVTHNPYVTWEEEEELRSPGLGISASSRASRYLAKTGLVDGNLPDKIPVTRTRETVDNHPNRFLKFVLSRWRDDTCKVLELLQNEDISAPVRRGITETEATLRFLDDLLHTGFFRDVSHLTHFPLNNPVLMSRAGYRDVYRAFVQYEMASRITWENDDDLFGAGQKNAAALYELWVYFQLAKVVSGLCDEPFDLSTLVEFNSDDFNVRIKRGRAVHLTGKTTLQGREMEVELWFNRTFSRDSHGGDSWSQTMRPDYSLRIGAAGTDDVWVHFDAKYRVNNTDELFSDVEAGDLLKMHAYKDAIRRTAGAYVIYPGNNDRQAPEYNELIPGLGAFGLFPSEDTDVIGAERLRSFMDQLLSEVASQVSHYTRGRYWERESYKNTAHIGKSTIPAPFISAPPVDTPVLVGYVKSREHWNWINSTGLYNIRADDREGSVPLQSKELAAELLVLYSDDQSSAGIYRTTGPVKILTRKHMLESGYPNPKGDLYFCFSVEPVVLDDEWNDRLERENITGVFSKLRDSQPLYAPLATTWFDFVEALEK